MPITSKNKFFVRKGRLNLKRGGGDRGRGEEGRGEGGGEEEGGGLM